MKENSEQKVRDVLGEIMADITSLRVSGVTVWEVIYEYMTLPVTLSTIAARIRRRCPFMLERVELVTRLVDALSDSTAANPDSGEDEDDDPADHLGHGQFADGLDERRRPTHRAGRRRKARFV